MTPPAGTQASGMRAIPTTDDPGEAEQTCPWATRSFVQSGAPPCHPGAGPLHDVWVDGGRDGWERFGCSAWVLAGQSMRLADLIGEASSQEQRS